MLERITLTPIDILDTVDADGVMERKIGQPIRLMARVRDVSGGERLEEEVRVETHDTEFEVSLLPSTAGCTPKWGLRARGHDNWEIVRALRRPAPNSGMHTRLLILARERR